MSPSRLSNSAAVFGFLILAGCPVTGATLDEGPWTIKVNGLEVGRAFATKPVSSVWGEYFERRDTGWEWPKTGVTWEVHARETTYGTSEQPNCVDNATYRACQQTHVTRTHSSSTSPSEWFAPNDTTATNAVKLNEYHTVGKLLITATYTNVVGGATVTKTADYFVSVDSGDTQKRKELICAQSGFVWPAKANPSRSEVVWTIAWVDSSAATTCPTGVTKHKYTVDLDP